MNSLKPEVIKGLIEYRDRQTKLADEYETKQQYETAYLARWAILENFVKTLAHEYRREMLRKSLAEWADYLDGKLKQKPKKPNFTLESYNLPEEKAFRACLTFYGLDADKVWAVMDSKGRFRKRRNNIAHNASRFGTRAKYPEMKKAMSGLTASIYDQLGAGK